MSGADHDHPPSSSPANPSQSAIDANSSPAGGSPVFTSEELFGDRVEVLIAHGDQLYRLRRTRNGKLILHK